MLIVVVTPEYPSNDCTSHSYTSLDGKLPCDLSTDTVHSGLLRLLGIISSVRWLLVHGMVTTRSVRMPSILVCGIRMRSARMCRIVRGSVSSLMSVRWLRVIV